MIVLVFTDTTSLHVYLCEKIWSNRGNGYSVFLFVWSRNLLRKSDQLRSKRTSWKDNDKLKTPCKFLKTHSDVTSYKPVFWPSRSVRIFIFMKFGCGYSSGFNILFWQRFFSCATTQFAAICLAGLPQPTCQPAGFIIRHRFQKSKYYDRITKRNSD